MINKLMIGRLGNQMFQYATIRAIQEKYYPNEKINLNFKLVYNEGPKEKGFYNQLECFNHAPFLIDNKIDLSFTQKLEFAKYVLGYKKLKLTNKGDYEINKRNYEIKIQDKLQKEGLFIFNYGYYEFSKSNKKNKLFAGFYESSKYFDNIKEDLQKEFTPKYEKKKENNDLYKKIENTNSVCVSIRRGDFLESEHIKKNYICTPEYFYEAVKIMNKKIENPQYVIFSDDVDWIKNNMNFPKGTLYESGKDPVWEKLRLMYECKHFIISNSTFSWWAQYLSRNDEKIVIAPKKWKNDGYNEDIYQDGWIKI